MKPGEGSDPFSSRLLSAAKKDRPTSDQVARAVALAIASSAVVPAAPPSPAASAGSALKIGLVAIGLSALGATGYVVASPGKAPGTPVVMTSAAAPSPVATEVTSAPSETAISVADLPTAPPLVTARTPAPSASSEAAPTLRDELAKLQAARRSLRASDAQGALAELASYRQLFPHGTLAAEEAALRIDAEVAAGDPARAKADAARFATDFPNSPEVARIRALAERLP